MKYLDNLIAWGDSLFRQDTIESINEATQLYVLAANMLGPRPQRIPPRGTVAAEDLRRAQGAGPRRDGQRAGRAGRPVPVQPRPAADAGRRPGRRRAALRHRPHALLLHPAQRQAARLLGHGRRPALQDPPLHEHRGRRAPARAVRSADRSRHAGQGGRGRHRHRLDRQRPEPADRPGALRCC